MAHRKSKLEHVDPDNLAHFADVAAFENASDASSSGAQPPLWDNDPVALKQKRNSKMRSSHSSLATDGKRHSSLKGILNFDKKGSSDALRLPPIQQERRSILPDDLLNAIKSLSSKKQLDKSKSTSSHSGFATAKPSLTSQSHKVKSTVVSGILQCNVNLSGKTAIVTGSNTGIGFETALDLSKRGAKVIMACRDLDKAVKAKHKILDTVENAELVTMKLDLASLASVHEFVKAFSTHEPRLDILINNAGVMMCPYWKTEDGYEMQLGVNHIGHFLLTNLLLDMLKANAPSRIVIVASSFYKKGATNWDNVMQESYYDPFKAYAVSKLANVLHCIELSKRLEGTGVTCNVIHPGVAKTDLGRHLQDGSHVPFLYRWAIKIFSPLLMLFMLSPIKGAQTTIFCAIAPELENVSGKYFGRCREEPLLPFAKDDASAKKLWLLSEQWTQK